MQQELSDIDVAGIGDILLKQQITQLLNFVESQIARITQLTKALEQANREIARLKGQPKKPHFSSNKKSSISVTEFLQDKTDRKKWNKKAKEVPIDQHVDVSEQTVCNCGSREFVSIRTTTKWERYFKQLKPSCNHISTASLP